MRRFLDRGFLGTACEMRAWVGRLVPLGPAKPVAKRYLAMDGTGVPTVPADTAGRAGEYPDGRARTREVNLDVLFTQTSVDDTGRPVRAPGSSSHVATLAPVEHFGLLVAPAPAPALGQDGPGWLTNGWPNWTAVTFRRCSPPAGSSTFPTRRPARSIRRPPRDQPPRLVTEVRSRGGTCAWPATRLPRPQYSPGQGRSTTCLTSTSSRPLSPQLEGKMQGGGADCGALVDQRGPG